MTLLEPEGRLQTLRRPPRRRRRKPERPGQNRTAIVGPSGSGKTTLLRIIAGFDRCQMPGSVLLERTGPHPASRPTAAASATWRRKARSFRTLSIAENIGFGLERTRILPATSAINRN